MTSTWADLPHRTKERMSLRIIINIPNLMVGFMNNMRSSSKKSSLYLITLKINTRFFDKREGLFSVCP